MAGDLLQSVGSRSTVRARRVSASRNTAQPPVDLTDAVPVVDSTSL